MGLCGYASIREFPTSRRCHRPTTGLGPRITFVLTGEVDLLSARLKRRGFAWLSSYRDLLGLCWIGLFALLYLSPVLKDGPAFGPADLGRGLSVLTHLLSDPPTHNNINGDIINQGIAWNTFSYQLIHQGHFPLWNPLSGNGSPQAFLNFESAVLALPSLLGYLVPLSVSFLVTVAAKLLIAGLGTYWCCRVLRAGPLAATLGGTTFMLSGAFSGWLGWSISGVYCFSGLALAGLICCYRSSRRTGPVLLLAAVVAFSIYAGFPEAEIISSVRWRS